MTPEEYTTQDGLGLAELVREGEVTPTELVDLALARIDALDPHLNAVVHRLDERARERISTPLTGPFAGVPSLLKDMLEVEGTTATMGSALLKDLVADHTHPLAARMEDSGLVFLGRTNMSELGMVPITESRLYGNTLNPWDPTRSPGGSSGGSAAAVASGMVPLAHAADGGGSIRIPASACGLFGLKPTRGRQPRSPSDEPDGFTEHHAVTRSVRDSAALLDATAQRHPRPMGRWWVPPHPEGSYLDAASRDPEPLRIGFSTRGLRGEPLHPDCTRAVEQAAALCEDLGHRVEEVAVPVDGAAFSEAFRVLWTAVGGVFIKLVARQLHQSDLPPWLVRLLQRRPGWLRAATALPANGEGGPLVEPLLRRLARQDTQLSPSDLWLAQVVLQETAAALERYYESHDLLLTTVLAEPPWPIGHLGKRMPGDDALAEALWGYIAFAPVANATGNPACSVPLHISGAGLPIGVQLMAPMAREDLLFGMAGQLERARPWAHRLPVHRRQSPSTRVG